MTPVTFIIPPEQDGQRVDSALSQLGELSRSNIQRLITQDRLTLDGKPARKNDKVYQGQTGELLIDEPAEAKALPEEIPLEIVYEDNDLIVINKQRGLVVHPSPGHESGTLVNALLHHCAGSLSGIGGEKRPGIVHRLDKDTSGLMICAKNDFTHTALSADLKARKISRAYECVAHGNIGSEAFTINAPIARDPKNRKRQGVVPGGREAVTHVYPLGVYNGYSHARCLLETGRTHQIRVHMAHKGHPVAGDPLYCGKDPLKLDGQCLYARELVFSHPRTREEMRFCSELPEWFVKVLVSVEK